MDTHEKVTDRLAGTGKLVTTGVLFAGHWNLTLTGYLLEGNLLYEVAAENRGPQKVKICFQRSGGWMNWG
jgi:hypothetical protein